MDRLLIEDDAAGAHDERPCYRSFDRHHLARARTGASATDVTWLPAAGCRTSASDVGIGMAARTVAVG
ncbi:hypothetical protein [Streptomyces eurythermus]|uniref:hypothetical protein n=1 Tax=Streptomyces eurythermus TaxID=42237 RepID=UPI0036D3E8AE